jgi:hypothetical protein
MIFVGGIPLERLVLGMLALLLLTASYDELIVDWLERHPTKLLAQTAWEVVAGVMIVLVMYLLIVQDSVITGTQSFVLILTCFVFGGAFMIRGSYNRTKDQQAIRV